jgi:hypothetical protein
MLSVLVPIYNFDVTPFIKDIHKQCLLAKINFEILLYDDFSDQAYKTINSTISELNKVTYLELPENYGRSKIRNRLAVDAKFNKLLFVDCDSNTEDEFYIFNYINQLTKHKVIYGGRSYSSTPPSDNNLFLRWFYGITREVKSASKRETEPYRNFMTNNFVIDKSIVLNTPFDESLNGYGYEDLLFAQELKSQGIEIHHIENSLIHIGLESAEEFINKTANGMKNLAKMIQAKQVDKRIKIYRVYNKLAYLHLNWSIKIAYVILRSTINKNLRGKRPNLKYFDLYKLYHLVIEMKS